MFGYLMEKEVRAISSLMEAPQHPFCAIVGGSKVSSKIGVIKALIEKVDSIIIGGGMTYTFAAAQGGKVGKSICEPDMFPVALEILELAKQKGVELVMSPDALIADDFSADADTATAPANDIPDGWEGVDIADEGKKRFREHILGCKTILWNGPVGVFEIDKFATGSKEVALAIAEATQKGAYSLIGGGDSVACINKFGLADKVSLHLDGRRCAARVHRVRHAAGRRGDPRLTKKAASPGERGLFTRSPHPVRRRCGLRPRSGWTPMRREHRKNE